MLKGFLRRARTALPLLLLLLAFSLGFAGQALAQDDGGDPLGTFGGGSSPGTCTRLQASCNYTVDPGASYCFAYGCTAVRGYRCCYYETGMCNDGSGNVGYSQICGGLCGCS
jgi:hypothetical protein